MSAFQIVPGKSPTHFLAQQGVQEIAPTHFCAQRCGQPKTPHNKNTLFFYLFAHFFTFLYTSSVRGRFRAHFPYTSKGRVQFRTIRHPKESFAKKPHYFPTNLHASNIRELFHAHFNAHFTKHVNTQSAVKPIGVWSIGFHGSSHSSGYRGPL